jgi:hypothetical protein
MRVTRRKAIGIVSAGTAGAMAEQTTQPPKLPTATAPPTPGAVNLYWLGGEAPQIPCGVSWGVPFPRGSVKKEMTFGLAGPNSTLPPVQTWPLAYWPDGSIKFLGVAASIPQFIASEYVLYQGTPVPFTPLTVKTAAETIEIDTGKLQCSISRTGRNLIASMKMDGREVVRDGQLRCSLDNGQHFSSDLQKVTVEQSGPVRAVVKLEGFHKADQGDRSWLPFVVRLYFYVGQEQVRLVHTIIFDGDQEKDFIRSLGLNFQVPMREQVHNRHVHFSTADDGVWAEPIQPLTGRRALPGNAFENQLAGKRIPDVATYDPRSQALMRDWAVWDSYKLAQATADGFIIQKRTNPESCWLDAGWGHRASGIAFVGDVTGGLAVAVKNMWRSYPTSLEIHNASKPAAELNVWLWSPDAAAMDLRHYDTKAHGLEASYEDVQPGFSTPHGVARTSELTLFPRTGVPTHEETAQLAHFSSQSRLLSATPKHIHDAKVFGIWSLPDRSNPAKTSVEDRLDAAFSIYQKEVEQRHWYGFWNYGDVMHQHDGPRHAWRYDIGGFAWDNTELGTDLFLWYSYLRTGRADIFRMAEAMTRHTSEVDTYHLGRFTGLGSRHNVRHWGCGAKEARISQAAYRRFYYYLTSDERTGDIMREVVDADYMLLELDPMRLATPVKTPLAYPARIRGGPDWLAYVGNWMTEWERTGNNKYRDKIIAGMDSIVAMPYGFLTGPDQLYGYDPKTGKMYPLSPDGMGTYNLATIMGGAEVVFELNELINHPKWKKVWLQYCRLYTAPRSVIKQDTANGGAEGVDAHFSRPGRLSAYVYRDNQVDAFAQRAWTGVRLNSFKTTYLEGPAVANPIDEIAGLSTNSTAQGCLEAIEVLEMCPGFVPEF